MATTIVLKNSVTTTNTPTSLTQGEVAINVTDKKVWVGNAATTPIQIVNGGPDGVFTSVTDSGLTNTRVTYAGAGGLLKDSANITTDGTILTATKFSGALNGTVGATTPSTGAFTTLTATSTLSFASQSIPYAALPAGTVLQVQNFTFTGTTAIASNAFTDTGVTVSITPKFSTSKILILATLQCSGPANIYFRINLVRNSTTIAQPTGTSQPSTANSYVGDLSINSEVYNVSMNYLDSPATTSATTYKIQGQVGSGTGYINTRSDGIGNQISTITVMEIAV